MQINILRVTVQ